MSRRRQVSPEAIHAGGGAPQPPDIIEPGPEAQAPLNLNVDVSQRKRTATPTERLEDRADRHIKELQDDKATLQKQMEDLRNREIPELRRDATDLARRVASLESMNVRLAISYQWAIAFSWFSFALIAIGGGAISYASFVEPPEAVAKIIAQKTIATIGFTSLVIGVFVQAFTSYRGTRAVTVTPEPMEG